MKPDYDMVWEWTIWPLAPTFWGCIAVFVGAMAFLVALWTGVVFF